MSVSGITQVGTSADRRERRILVYVVDPAELFQTGQSLWLAHLHRQGLIRAALCVSRQQKTMNHTVNTWLLTEFEGGLHLLDNAEDDALNWLETTDLY